MEKTIREFNLEWRDGHAVQLTVGTVVEARRTTNSSGQPLLLMQLAVGGVNAGSAAAFALFATAARVSGYTRRRWLAFMRRFAHAVEAGVGVVKVGRAVATTAARSLTGHAAGVVVSVKV